MNFKQYLAEQTNFDYDEFEDSVDNDEWLDDENDDLFSVFTDEEEEDELVFEESDDFKPHMMYDPKTGKGYKAKKPEDHITMKKMGYVHEKPESYEGECDECGEESDSCECVMTERLIKKKVIRNGKRQIKWKSDRPGYKVVRDGNRVKEVKMSPTEIRMRKKQQKIAARKRKRTSSQSSRKRKRSMARRTF